MEFIDTKIYRLYISNFFDDLRKFHYSETKRHAAHMFNTFHSSFYCCRTFCCQCWNQNYRDCKSEIEVVFLMNGYFFASSSLKAHFRRWFISSIRKLDQNRKIYGRIIFFNQRALKRPQVKHNTSRILQWCERWCKSFAVSMSMRLSVHISFAYAACVHFA